MHWMILPLWFKLWELDPKWLENVGDSYSWFASTMAAIAIAYMGFNGSWPNPFGGNRKNSAPSPTTYKRGYSDEGEVEYYEVNTHGDGR